LENHRLCPSFEGQDSTQQTLSNIPQEVSPIAAKGLSITVSIVLWFEDKKTAFTKI
jgi:hypothetical protein